VTVETSSPDTRRYTLGRHESRSLLGNRDRGEVAVLVAGIVIGLLAALVGGATVGSFVLLSLSVGAATAAVFVPVRGRTLYRWLPLDMRHARAVRRGSNRYVNAAREAGTTLAGETVDVAPPAAVGALKWLAIPYRGGQLAVVVQQDGGGITAVLEIEGPGVGLYDAVEQEASTARWGAVLRDLANADGFVSRLSLIERTLPADPEAHAAYVDNRGDDSCSPGLQASYAELQSRINTVTEQHLNYLVLRLGGDRLLARAVRLAGGGDAGLGAVVIRELDAVVTRLEDAGLRFVRGLSTEQLTSLLRSQHDPDHPVEESAHLHPRDAWPRQMAAERESLVAGDWHHATAWVKGWPMVGVGVGFLAPLLVQTPGLIRTVAVTQDLVSTEVAMSRAMSDLTSDAADELRAAKQGRVADPRRARQAERVDQRAQDLADGAAGVHLVGYITVSARGADELAVAKRKLRTAAAQAWLVLEWCDKEHDRAFVNTLPFARGLR
jgi:hypothetical protein